MHDRPSISPLSTRSDRPGIGALSACRSGLHFYHARACFDINVLGTIAIQEAALDAGVPRMVAFSSGNAYRTAPGARTEDDPLFPNRRAGYYLASKAAGDMLADYYRQAKGLCTATLRVASVYGPDMAPGSFLPLCLDRLLDIAKAKRAFGYAPRPLEAGLRAWLGLSEAMPLRNKG